MVIITDNGWTLHYTIGSVIAAPVEEGDEVDLSPTLQDIVVTVEAASAPKRVKDTGRVVVKFGEYIHAYKPKTLSMVWVSASGGVSELLD